MKHIRLLLFLFFSAGFCIPALSAQELMTLPAGCNFAATDTLKEVYTYPPSQEALRIVEEIMRVNVLPQNFIVRSSDCNNALATTTGKQRYILYSTSFLENFKKEAKTRWAAYCVLAHEVGHHLSNHDLEETDVRVRKRYELEADKFSGGILYRLGASLEEAQAGINTFSDDNGSRTHPPKRARLEAVAVGWKQAEELAQLAEETKGVADADSEEKRLFDQAAAATDPFEAIYLLDQAIALKADYAAAYLERGRSKINIENVDEYRADYKGAVADLTVYLQLRPKDPAGYVERGYAYRRLNEDAWALEDYNHAIRLDAGFADAYLGRAWIYMKGFDYPAALRDLDQAIQLRPDFTEAYYWRGYIRLGMNDNELALADFDQVLGLQPDHATALELRALIWQRMERWTEAVADYNRLQQLQGEAFISNMDRGACYQMLGNHAVAIRDFDEVLQRNSGASEAYMYRGVSEAVMGRADAAQADFDQALAQTSLKINTTATIGCMLVKFGRIKDGLVWLDKVLSEYPDNDQAKACKAEALKK
ncbi:MAG: tetratricopeptide repeat protein [Bacteroidetes bacterium]|nr:MAG: tetratricopeptide repeat protein [Bacteroidota bacterium]